MIFELQFALFEAAQLQLVVMAVGHQHVYDRIQIAMFHVEFDEAALDFLDIGHIVVFPGLLFQKLKSARPEEHYNRKQFGYVPESLYLQHYGFPVHSLIYGDVAANIDCATVPENTMVTQRGPNPSL